MCIVQCSFFFFFSFFFLDNRPSFCAPPTCQVGNNEYWLIMNTFMTFTVFRQMSVQIRHMTVQALVGQLKETVHPKIKRKRLFTTSVVLMQYAALSLLFVIQKVRMAYCIRTTPGWVNEQTCFLLWCKHTIRWRKCIDGHPKVRVNAD